MNYDWKNIDLKNACIFDLTDDIQVIREVLSDDEITLKDKDIYKSEWSHIRIACDMLTYAHEIADLELVKELEKVFKAEYDEHEAIFNE
jgi:alanine dehydrogenase